MGIWYHGSKQQVDVLDVNKSSGMNLWGGRGSYLTQNKRVAAMFGPCVNRFEIGDLDVLNTDNEIHDNDFSAVNSILNANVPFMTLAHADVKSYGEAMALCAQFGLGNKETAVQIFQEVLGFDALLTEDVTSVLRGGAINEGDLLILLSPEKAQFLDAEYVRVPNGVFFHGGRSEQPIQRFVHGIYPAKSGIEGLGCVSVERHAFFFSSVPAMSSEYGNVHAYALPTSGFLDIRNDLSAEDAAKLEQVGINTRWIDGMPTESKWQIFDGEDGDALSAAIRELGYCGVDYWECDKKGILRHCRAVVDSEIPKPLPIPTEVISQLDVVLSVVDALKEVSNEIESANDNGVSSVLINDILANFGLKGDSERLFTLLKRSDHEGLVEAISISNPTFCTGDEPNVDLSVHCRDTMRVRRSC
ncbi:hypothetical protein [Alteromonas sp. 14N.309.X.WAT.G.H12]|uniref:hypothetical protein n=1 Tax=Alteromonas sp. 14N.309.X.WAT.G.H12 TaxID=3120824 RepID=UPI002FD3A86E